jgi:ribosome-binding protein aMBF1 (putative translation factor)
MILPPHETARFYQAWLEAYAWGRGYRVMQVDIQAKSPQQVIVELERALGLSRDDMARALDVNVRTVERWRKGTSIPQREARAARRPADIA